MFWIAIGVLLAFQVVLTGACIDVFLLQSFLTKIYIRARRLQEILM
jgi:hypothetical protein